MARYLTALLLAFIISGTVSAQAPTFPAPIGFINDYEHNFNKAQLQVVNDAIREMLRMSIDRDYPKGMEIAIVSVSDSMFGAEKDINAYAAKLLTEWGVGKETGNGIVIAFSKDRNTVAVVTGTRLERILPEDVCKQIAAEKIIPQFRKNEYVDGLLDGINTLATMLGLKGGR